MNLIVFISGKASAGKDSFAKSLLLSHLVREDKIHISSTEQVDRLFASPSYVAQVEGKPFIFAPFADEVRRELCRLHPEVSFSRLISDYAYKTKFRKELIDIGHGYRTEHPQVWINKHFEYLKEKSSFLNSSGICAVPDLRYLNELEYSKFLQKEDGFNSCVFTVRVEAKLSTRLLRMSPDGAKSYLKYGRYNPGECELDSCNSFDYVIDNNPQILGNGLNYKLYQVFEPICNEILNVFEHVNK